jgi:hypothetical protein
LTARAAARPIEFVGGSGPDASSNKHGVRAFASGPGILLTLFDDLEQEFRAFRRRAPCILLPFTLKAAHRAAAGRITAALEHEASTGIEPPYHSRYHVAESVLAMDLLSREAIRLRLIDEDLASLGILAMIGHDLGHDGTLPDTTRLEQYAAAEVAVLTTDLGPAACDILRRVILATAPAHVPHNLALSRAAHPAPLDTLCALANEADVLASLLPELGWDLGDLLAEEWRVHDAVRAAIARSFTGRQSFMLLYASPSPAACSLGLDRVIARGLDAFEPDGTVALDLLPRADAMDRYRSRLDAIPA